jgi:hypothetical protein
MSAFAHSRFGRMRMWKGGVDVSSCGQARECTCSPGIVGRYQKRASGPLMDCIDTYVVVP